MKKTLRKIKTGTFERGFSLAKTTLAAGARTAQRSLGQLFQNAQAKEESIKKLYLEHAESFARELGQLKGSIMKVGQSLSVLGEFFLPPEINKVLKSLQQESPPLDWSEMQKTLRRRLSAERLAALDIEPVALAAASLGQVHLATRKSDGKKIALKIQYPGVEKAIDGDIRTLKRLLVIARLSQHRERLDLIMEEVREMLHQEVDYQREAALMEEYRQIIAGDERFVLPQVISEFSARKILATEYIDGLKVDDPAVLALSQERRDLLGLAFLELYLREFYQFGLVQTDPHFGNYRILLGNGQDQPDRIALLDFGAVRKFSQDFRRSYKLMVLSLLEGKDQAALQAAYELEFLKPEDEDHLQQEFIRVCRSFIEPFLDDERPYDFAASDLPKRIAKEAAQLVMAFRFRPPPREIVFLDRKLGGVFIFLSVLRAKLATRKILEQYLR